MASANRKRTEISTASDPKTDPVLLLLLQMGAWKEPLGKVIWPSFARISELCWLEYREGECSFHPAEVPTEWMPPSAPLSSTLPITGVECRYLRLEPFRNLFNSIEMDWWLWSWCDLNRQVLGAKQRNLAVRLVGCVQAHRPDRSYGPQPMLLLWAL